MRTTLATMALALLCVAGCARDRCSCVCSSPCDTTAPATSTNKPSVVTTKRTTAPMPTADGGRSPYAGVPAIPSASSPPPLPAVKHWWPAIRTPLPVASPRSEQRQPPVVASHPPEQHQPPAVTSSPPEQHPPSAVVKPSTSTTAPVSRQLADRPETPATELPEPAKLPVRSGESVPQQPKSPEAPAETSPEALNLGQTPEPEIAPILQTGGTAEPPLAQVPAVAQRGEGKILTGVVESWRKTWRLRYAAIDVEDANGGRVTLVGPNLGELQEGQHVRVRGILIPAADRGSAPTFDVETVEVLD